MTEKPTGRLARAVAAVKRALSGVAARFRRGPAAVPAEVRPDRGSFVTESVAGVFTYKLYVPAGHEGRALPLVVMLHGCTQSPDDFAAGTRMNALADEHGVLVAYPAQTAQANQQKCWNWFSPEHQRRDGGEPALIAAATRQIAATHPVDPARIYVAGLSAGGAAAAILAAAYPDLYAAVGVHSGLPAGAARNLPSAFLAMRTGARPESLTGDTPFVPTIVFHGDEDSTVHPRNGDQVIARARASAGDLRASVERGDVPDGHSFTRTVHRDPAGRALCEHWAVHGLGHAWSGGSPAGTYTDPRGPDAAGEMLRFFLEHRLAPAG